MFQGVCVCVCILAREGWSKRHFGLSGPRRNLHDPHRPVLPDSGFKEGVDLFDVKYVHIFENQRNNADLIQAIGRATRSCGQKGLNFLPNVGWPLHVYQYYLTFEDPTKIVFDDYLQYAGVDLNMLVISENIEKLAIETAVDYDARRDE